MTPNPYDQAARYAAKLDPLTGAVCSLEEIDHMVDELDAAMAPWRDGATPSPALTATR